jgi:acyl carrier protein
MEINEFIEKFADQFENTGIELMTANTKFKNLDEWSSLLALSIIAMVDDEYGVAVKGSDIRNSETIEDLFKTVLERKQ